MDMTGFGKNIFNSFFGYVMSNFGICIFATSTVAFLVGEEGRQEVGMMALAGVGMSYVSILQLLLFAILITTINYAFSLKIKNMLVLWRVAIQIVLTTGFTILFAVLFHWFPINDSMAWISFLISFTICITVSMLLVMLKLKLDNKKYQRQLSEYKANKNNKEGKNQNDSNE